MATIAAFQGSTAYKEIFKKEEKMREKGKNPLPSVRHPHRFALFSDGHWMTYVVFESALAPSLYSQPLFQRCLSLDRYTMRVIDTAQHRCIRDLPYHDVSLHSMP